jgi:Flp pilus assembly protein TadG
MRYLHNREGSVLVFVTLMIVLLLVMVGMGLDTGQLAFTRSTAQPALDAAALAAASAIPTGDINQVRTRATLFNSANNYTGSNQVAIQGANVTLMTYNPGGTPELQAAASIATANAARVALENSNPYDAGATNTPVQSPLFLTPLFNLLGSSAPGSARLNVTAVAVTTAVVGLPMAVELAKCGQPNPQHLLQSTSGQGNGNNFNDNSGYTTYWINSTSATSIRDFLKASDSCSGGIAANSGVGYCTQLNNGQITGVYSDFNDLFTNNPGKCYLVPVVANGSDWSHCQNIIEFATWCPDALTPVVQSGNDKYLLGNLTCPSDPNTVNPSLKCYTQVLVRDKTSGM